MKAPDPLLDQQALERLERLALRWRSSFSGALGGSNVSRFAGSGHEFLDHRHFHQGDDLRSVNWRAFLRLERMFLKMFRIEPRTPVRVLLDTSESMASDTAGEPKFWYACRLAAALCYVGLVRLETMVLQPFAHRLDEPFRAHGGRHRFAHASRFLGGLRTGGHSDFAHASRELLGHLGAPGLVIVLSDFLDDGDSAAALRRVADRGHELLLVHVVSPEDRQPPWRGDLELLDAESGNVVRLELDSGGAAEYAEAFEGYARELEYAALRNGGRYLQLETAVPLEEALYGAMLPTGAVALG